MIADAEALLGPEPSSMGFIKNAFWSNFRHDLLFPFPAVSNEERAACDELLARLDQYLRDEHPAIEIDQRQEIPRWVIDKLFSLGVLGMTIPPEYGGLGLGITSYNRVLERIGRSCGSTAVLVSAHQSIGCKAIMLFGNEEQKTRWLPRLAKDWLSAFCLSEPNVGCDAGGQETRCAISDDGEHYILNGEKKWATSGALSGLFTVMAKQMVTDPTTGKTSEKVSALVCTPDMPGIHIFQKNRSKMSIRGTWQARIRFADVKVPKSHLLAREGKGLNVALSCLNYGRCTLSAAMLGGAKRAFEQSTKWSQQRYQFQRPLSAFELVQQKIGRMSAYVYAMESVLYMTTGMLDRHDDDIMIETASCKVFCSEYGWRVANDAMQIMGGEAFMTENEVERIFRDSRINTVVEGANEVMQSFIFAYGGKQLAEKMLGVQQAFAWDSKASFFENIRQECRAAFNLKIARAALPLAKELFLNWKALSPTPPVVQPSLQDAAGELSYRIRDLSFEFKRASKANGEKIVSRQATQARLADVAVLIHAWACTLSRINKQVESKVARDFEIAAAMHFFDLANHEIVRSLRELRYNSDETMRSAAAAALQHVQSLPDSDYSVPEKSPVISPEQGRERKQDGIAQFPGAEERSDTPSEPVLNAV